MRQTSSPHDHTFERLVPLNVITEHLTHGTGCQGTARPFLDLTYLRQSPDGDPFRRLVPLSKTRGSDLTP